MNEPLAKNEWERWYRSGFRSGYRAGWFDAVAALYASMNDDYGLTAESALEIVKNHDEALSRWELLNPERLDEGPPGINWLEQAPGIQWRKEKP